MRESDAVQSKEGDFLKAKECFKEKGNGRGGQKYRRNENRNASHKGGLW